MQRTRDKNGSMTDEQRDRLTAAEFSWAPVDEKWEAAYQDLKKYKEEFGNVRVNVTYHVPGSNFALGNWVSIQRMRYKNGTIPAEQIERLNELGFIWDGKRVRFDIGVEAMRNFFQEHGHGRVLPKQRTPDGTPKGYGLGFFVQQKRQLDKNGMLSEEDRALLTEAGMVWVPFGEDWEKGFEKLKEYIVSHGHSQITALFKCDDGYQLGGWARRQRSQFAKQKLASEKISRLESLIGWTWT